MKIKWGALVVDGRGKLGGHVASANKGGAYLRSKVTPTNPRSLNQTEVRSMFGAISQEWSGLSQSAISAWNEAVDEWKRTNIFGDLKQPSGKALYQRLNQQARLAGYPAIPLPPNKKSMVEGIISKITLDIGNGTITYTTMPAGTDYAAVYYATGPVSRGTTFVKNRLRVFHTSPNGAATPADLYTAYAAKYGVANATQKLFFGVVYVLSNGQASPMQSALGVG